MKIAINLSINKQLLIGNRQIMQWEKLITRWCGCWDPCSECQVQVYQATCAPSVNSSAMSWCHLAPHRHYYRHLTTHTIHQPRNIQYQLTDFIDSVITLYSFAHLIHSQILTSLTLSTSNSFYQMSKLLLHTLHCRHRHHHIYIYIQGGPKKPDCFLTVCNSRICWHRIAFYTSNCSVFYPE